MKQKQKELQKYYQIKFENFELSDSYSSPHLISLENEKINTDIMVVGQETNSWYGNFHDFNNRGIDKQMKIYDNFMRENYHSMSNIFFRYVRDIIGDDDTIPVWTNLFKFDLGDDREKRNISTLNKKSDEFSKIIDFHSDILAREIEIIQPKIIIFFTGHPYDKIFFDKIVKKDDDYQKLYKEIGILKDKDIDRWKCGILDLSSFEDFSSFDGRAIRTYHPGYLNRNLKKFGDDILKYIKSEIKG